MKKAMLTGAGSSPIGQRVEIQTVADMVVWLALDAPDDITAERLNVSGGLDRD